MLSFTAARWLLVLHTFVGLAAVASGTHLVIWLRRYVRGAAGRRRATLRFAWIFFALQLAAFGFGATMYPTYRVEVRAAYLDNPQALAAAAEAHARAVEQIAAREHVASDAPAQVADRVAHAKTAPRWFDVKEHWVALGLIASVALLAILHVWKLEDGPAVAPFVLGLAVLASGTTWLAAIIGILTAAWRAI